MSALSGRLNNNVTLWVTKLMTAAVVERAKRLHDRKRTSTAVFNASAPALLVPLRNHTDFLRWRFIQGDIRRATVAVFGYSFGFRDLSGIG